MKKAIVIGATGLVGNQVLKQLLQDNDYSEVKIFVRRSTGISHDKLIECIIDFNQLSDVKDQITGDVLFSCLGTTLKQAGSKAAQYTVDYTYQYEFAKLAQANGVKDYLLVSSTSASPQSKFFYSRIKGELEEAVKALDFKRVIILQPSVLTGDRESKRMGEGIGAIIANGLGRIFPALKKYRSISGGMVAKALIHFSKISKEQKVKVYQLDELFIG